MDDQPEYKQWWLEAEERYDAALARAAAAEAKLAERDTPCVWQKDFDNWYQLGCGKHETFVKDGEYCPKCGHRIEVTT